jgi:hypothetical protein
MFINFSFQLELLGRTALDRASTDSYIRLGAYSATKKFTADSSRPIS